MTVAPKCDKDNRLTLERRAVIFFYFRFIRSEIITINTATAKIASVVIIYNPKVQTNAQKRDFYKHSPTGEGL